MLLRVKSNFYSFNLLFVCSFIKLLVVTVLIDEFKENNFDYFVSKLFVIFEDTMYQHDKKVHNSKGVFTTIYLDNNSVRIACNDDYERANDYENILKVFNDDELYWGEFDCGSCSCNKSMLGYQVECDMYNDVYDCTVMSVLENVFDMVVCD